MRHERGRSGVADCGTERSGGPGSRLDPAKIHVVFAGTAAQFKAWCRKHEVDAWPTKSNIVWANGPYRIQGLPPEKLQLHYGHAYWRAGGYGSDAHRYVADALDEPIPRPPGGEHTREEAT